MCGADSPPPPRDAAIVVDSPNSDAPPPDADVTAPTVFSTTPQAMATGVSRTATINVTFDEAVINVDGTSFSVAIGGNSVAGTVVAQDTQTYRFTPTNMVMANATVTVSLTAAITDLAGNALVPVSFVYDTGT